jgi:hypothetical protein
VMSGDQASEVPFDHVYVQRAERLDNQCRLSRRNARLRGGTGNSLRLGHPKLSGI